MWEIRKIISVRGLRRKFAKAVQSQLFWDIKIALYQICALLQWWEGKAISIVRLCDWRIEMGCTRSESQLLKEDKLYWTKDSTVLLVIMRSLAKKECKFGSQTKHDTQHWLICSKSLFGFFWTNVRIWLLFFVAFSSLLFLKSSLYWYL